MNRITAHDIKEYNELCDDGQTPRIVAFDKNKIKVWGRNYKDKIKMDTLITYKTKKGQVIENNVMYELEPMEVWEIIHELTAILERRK